MEIALESAMPTYAGGLGILAGEIGELRTVSFELDHLVAQASRL
jgi:hypothetical protein